MDVRIRLRPWLESRLNGGWIDGLCWIDREKGIFRIPWKHHSKHTWTEQDAAIFKDWAVVTGRFKEGIDEPDWPMWKTRLRCALNKAPDIEEIRQRHNLQCDEPFKVYRFISKTESLWRANSTRNASMIFDGVLNSDHKLSPCHSYSPITNKRPAIFLKKFLKADIEGKPITLIQKMNDFLPTKRMHLEPQIRSNFDAQLVTPRCCELVDSLEMGGMQELSNHTVEQRVFAGNCNFNSQGSIFNPAKVNCLVYIPTGITTPILPDVTEPEYHQLGVRILHLNVRTKDSIVTNPNGCCIYFGRCDELTSPSSPDPIEAQISRFVSEANKAYVDLLLENLNRGIFITCTHGNIYVERMCKCAVFVYVPSCDGYIFLKKLSRREKEKVFDYRQFMNALECSRTEEQVKPYFEVILAFGQQLRSGLSTESLLLWCRLANCRAWFQLQKALSFPSEATNSHLQGPSHSFSYLTSGRESHCGLRESQEAALLASSNGDCLLGVSSQEFGLCGPAAQVSGEEVIEEGVEIPLDDHDRLVYDEMIPDTNGVVGGFHFTGHQDEHMH